MTYISMFIEHYRKKYGKKINPYEPTLKIL